MRVDEAIAAVLPDVLSLAESIRAEPELSGGEFRSAEKCLSVLAASDFEIERSAGGLPTAFIGRRRFGGGGVKIAFLAEYDALPGIGHGCGHHLIAACSVGAALAASLVATEDDEIEIVVVGTPSEETIGGKVVLAEAGLFEGIHAAMMFHAGHEWRTYTDSLACQSVEVIFGGKASHAVAAPEAGVNALEAMIDLFLDVRAMRGRFSRDVRLPGIILEGGQRANIVPDRSVARFSARASSAEELDRVVQALLDAVASIAARTGCRSRVRPVDNPYDEMNTNRALAAVLREELAARGRTTNDAPRKAKGSIDVGNVSRRTPSVHAYFPAASPDVALHTRAFADATAAEACRDVLCAASASMASTALRLAREPALRARVRAEFEEAPLPSMRRRWPLLTREPEPRIEC